MAAGNFQTLIFCFDGTGNEPSDAGQFQENESITNILKLHLLLGGGRAAGHEPCTTLSGRPQRSFYYSGIGTLEAGYRIPLLGALRRSVNMALAPTFGDAGRILDAALEDFTSAGWRQGDKLLVFGYSRGAALARKFASLILRDDPPCTVSFLGAFDTVAAMGGIHREGERIASDVVFEHGTLDRRIDRAVHLLALDEDRVPFTPTLMNKDAQDAGKDARDRRILEVWFPGVHGDVGGGHWHDGLSDLALQFMLAQCGTTLRADVRFDDPAEVAWHLASRQDALAAIDWDDLAIHPLSHGPLHAHGGMGAALMARGARSVHVSDEDRPSADPTDLPLIHQSVAERFARVAGYRPPALRGLTFRLADGPSQPVRGTAGLRQLLKPPPG